MGDEKHPFVRFLKSRCLIRPPVDQDPRLFTNFRKNIILVILSLSGAMCGFSSTIYFPSTPDIEAELHGPPITTTLAAALFVFFSGVAPIIWCALSDFYRVRRFLAIVSMIIFALSSLGCAIINNIWGLVALRCSQAIGASAVEGLGGGIITDLYPVEQRGKAFGKFYLGLFLCPVIGPIIGGFLTMSDSTWRATFWFCVAFGVFIALLTVLCVPETFRDSKKFDAHEKLPETSNNAAPIVTEDEGYYVDNNDSRPLGEEADENGQLGSKEKLKSFNPIRPLLLLRYPVILLTSLVSAFAFALMFTVETVLPRLFEQNYSFNAWQIGVSYLGAGTGHVFGAVTNGLLSDWLLLRARSRRGGYHKVEDRITLNIWPCCFIFMPIGLLLFGWSLSYGMSYWVPVVAFGVQTYGMNQITASAGAYLTEVVPAEHAASVSAAGLFVSMVLGAIMSLTAFPILEAIGPGHLTVFLAGLGWLSAGILLVVKVSGQLLRRRNGLEQELELKHK